jgi:protocatechuate 3,4-dioxygenase beta subunit
MISLLFALLLAPQDRPAERCTISGVVVDSVTGQPLNKVQVLAENLANTHSAPAFTTTDAEGNFTLVQLEAGQYRLKGVRNGYLETYHGARRAESKGITVALEAGEELKDIPLKLLPFAVVAGVVRDPEGEPLAEARVALIAVTYRNGARQARAIGQYATTDDLGQYRIPYVRPGRYYVRAGPKQRDEWRSPVDHSPKGAPAPETLVPAFHPTARELGTARWIEVAAGSHFTGADVTLLRSRVFHVRVRVAGPPGLSIGVGLEDRQNFGDGLDLHPPSNCKEHICEFSGVPSGLYSAIATAQPPNITFRDLLSNSSRYRASVPVDVAGANVDDVQMIINAGAEVAGHVAVLGGDHVNLTEVKVTFVDVEGEEHLARISEDGTFTARLSQGRYEVKLHSGLDLIPKSIRSDEVDVLQEGLMVSGSGQLPLEIVLSSDGATIGGMVQGKDDRPAPGATVVLIPETNLQFRHDLYQQTTTDQYGRYRFRLVTPGEYKLFAGEDIEPGIWFDADFLKSIETRSQTVTVQAKEERSAALHLSLSER